jgi:hypothetical protein
MVTERRPIPGTATAHAWMIVFGMVLVRWREPMQATGPGVT